MKQLSLLVLVMGLGCAADSVQGTADLCEMAADHVESCAGYRPDVAGCDASSAMEALETECTDDKLSAFGYCFWNCEPEFGFATTDGTWNAEVGFYLDGERWVGEGSATFTHYEEIEALEAIVTAHNEAGEMVRIRGWMSHKRNHLTQYGWPDGYFQVELDGEILVGNPYPSVGQSTISGTRPFVAELSDNDRGFELLLRDGRGALRSLGIQLSE